MANDVEKRITAKFVADTTGLNKSVGDVNRQLKLAQSEFKNTSTQIGVFGKDSEKLKSVQDGLAKQVELHSKKVDLYKNSIEKTTSKMQDNIKERDRLKVSLDSSNKAYDEAVKLYGKESEQAQKAKEEVSKLEKEYKNKEKAIESNTRQIQNYETNMNKANTQMVKTQGELNKINQELDKSNNKWLQASDTLKKNSESLKSVGEGMNKAGNTILKATAPLVGLGAASLKFGIDFESAFAGVKKTVDATDEQLSRLSDGIRNMAKEIPSSATAIAGVAEAAGQLGIQTNNILGFTRVMIDLGEATNLSADEAATSLARFANITQMSQGDFDKLGSTIVALGNSMATTESEIVAMGMGLAGAGAQVGLTEAQIMSFAGALSSVGIEAQAGGSAFSKVMIEMQLAVETNSEKLQDFANVAGMSATQFKQAFKEDSAGAIIAFIKGLSDAEKQGTSTIKILDDMGITEVRLRDALLRASGASDVFSEAIKTGTKAWDENIALSNEAAQRYETTESKLKILKNQFVDVGIKLGDVLIPYLEKGVDKLGEFADWLGNVDSETLESTAKMVGFAVAIGGVLKVGGGAISTVGNIAGGLSKLTKVLGATKVATAGVGTVASVAGGTAGLGGLAAGLGGAVVAAAPFLLAGAAVAGVGYTIYKGMTEEAIPAIDLFADKVEYAATSIDGSYSRMSSGYETTVTTISESTKTAVGAYLELDESAKKSIDSIYIHSTEITEQMKNELIGKYEEMGATINSTTEQKRIENINDLQEFFNESKALSEREESDILANTEKYYSDKQKTVQGYEDEIKRIIEIASNERRKLTETEVMSINGLQQKMKEEAVKILSENEIEAQIILQRMKDYDTRITAEQTAEHILKLNESRDKAVAVANEEYEKRIATIIKMRDEAKVISTEQADALIEDAGRQRDGIVQRAEETRLEALDKMRRMNKDLDEQVETTTGKILTWWDKLKRWWGDWKPETKTFETQQKTYSTVVTSYASVGGKPAVSANWTGTNSFQGGLTTLHEKGYEVYDLPRGTRIYNHEASEDMVIKAAEEVVGKMFDKNNMGGYVQNAPILHVDNLQVRNDGDIQKITDKIVREMNKMGIVRGIV
ncbi:phage tail tape measure protein [Proteiniborus sp. MB09-C3]|uniref:phage tail tape measure protein n=1 Tax=Proteiniborus sp. MB09-C3 TaxID=3050072 RepID=UPI002555A6FE|nr:phage tail tape measure protein [Proteiniborus sp. MB09-C3]WIV10545.1 phage tail tape measure protein [Proteiniborus sp. MB09-C3]